MYGSSQAAQPQPGLVGTVGRDTVASGYSFAARMDKFRRLYDQLLGRGETAAGPGATLAG